MGIWYKTDGGRSRIHTNTTLNVSVEVVSRPISEQDGGILGM